MQRSRQGYHLNMFCMSLMKPENRTEFKANEAAYLKKFPMTQEQREAVLKRDWNRMIELGGNIYFLAKLFSVRRPVVPARRGADDRLYAGAVCTDDDSRRAIGRRQPQQVRAQTRPRQGGAQAPWLRSLPA